MEKKAELDTPRVGFGLYVHWPFCLAKCPYCDFNSHVRHGGIDSGAFGQALVRELKQFAQRTKGRTVTSVFFGGGTPSLMPPDTVGDVLDAAADYWGIASNAEVTLEANPTSAEASHFRGYRIAGVNRVSVGVQALNEADLKMLGRQHSVAEALKAFRAAVQTFPQTSFDLIYARPHQSLAAWRAELQQALSEQQGHMSLYQLTIEPGTPFAGLHARGKLILPDDDAAADLYNVTQELTVAAGVPAYEVSNHAWPGRQSRHNMLYWRYGEYAGIGPGAHSRLIDVTGQRVGVSTLRDPQDWQSQVVAVGHGICEEVAISATDAARERLLMGLRLVEGIELADLEFGAGTSIDTDKLDHLIDHGLVVAPAPGRVAATPAGRMVLDAVIDVLAV